MSHVAVTVLSEYNHLPATAGPSVQARPQTAPSARQQATQPSLFADSLPSSPFRAFCLYHLPLARAPTTAADSDAVQCFGSPPGLPSTLEDSTEIFSHGKPQIIPLRAYRSSEISMDFRKFDGHVPQIRDFLALESVQIGLQCRRCILEILSRSLQGVLELKQTQSVGHRVSTIITDPPAQYYPASFRYSPASSPRDQHPSSHSTNA